MGPESPWAYCKLELNRPSRKWNKNWKVKIFSRNAYKNCNFQKTPPTFPGQLHILRAPRNLKAVEYFSVYRKEKSQSKSIRFSSNLECELSRKLRNFHEKLHFFAPRKVLQTVFCYLLSHGTFIFSGRKLGVWVYLIRACTTGSDPGSPSNHAKHAIFKV